MLSLRVHYDMKTILKTRNFNRKHTSPYDTYLLSYYVAHGVLLLPYI